MKKKYLIFVFRFDSLLIFRSFLSLFLSSFIPLICILILIFVFILIFHFYSSAHVVQDRRTKHGDSSSSRSISSASKVQYYARIFITAKRNLRSKFSRTNSNSSVSSNVSTNSYSAFNAATMETGTGYFARSEGEIMSSFLYSILFCHAFLCST